MIGEPNECRRFAKVREIGERGEFEEAVSVPAASRERREHHRHLHDEGMIDGVVGDERFLLLRLRARSGQIHSWWTPRMGVIQAGLKCIQGKGIVNSIPQRGEEKFRQNAAPS